MCFIQLLETKVLSQENKGTNHNILDKSLEIHTDMNIIYWSTCKLKTIVYNYITSLWHEVCLDDAFVSFASLFDYRYLTYN